MSREMLLISVLQDLRLSFNLLKSRADHLHEDLGVNASMRAVMEVLSDADDITVPEIARQRGVSRQHIQVIVNGLVGRGWVDTMPSPSDRRTYLVSLSKAGHALFREIANREKAELIRLVDRLPEQDLKAASRFLKVLNESVRQSELV